MTMLLSIIIVSYNTKDLTLQTLRSVLENDLTGQTEIFIVDNASTDDSVTALKPLCKKNCTIIQNTENLGFAQANNAAIERSQGKYILLLNSDTIVEPHALEKMVASFEHQERLGVLSATLLNPDGSGQRQGGSFPTILSLTSHMLFLDDLPLVGRFLPSTQHTGRSKRQLDRIDWVGGTAMMLRRQMLDEIGPLDQNIFMYGEDIEYCMRAKFHHWDVAIEADARITHFGSASSSSANALIGEFNGYLYIWSKHKPLWQVPLVKAILWWGALVRWLIFGTIVRNPAKARAYRTILRNMVR